MPRNVMTCRRCGIERMVDQFERRVQPSGKAYRLRICKVCEPNPRRYDTGGGPWKADSPCKQCGKEIWRTGPRCRVRMLLYCSDRCDRLGRRKALRKCTRCERRLPFEHFDRPPTAKRHRQNTCRQCVAKSHRDQEEGTQRVGPAAMLKMSRTQARKIGVPHTLRISDTRRIYDGDCYLCGKAPYSLHLRERSVGFVVENVWGLCLRCKKSVRRCGMAEMLTWSLEIAARHFKAELTLPEYRKPAACEHCGQLPQAQKEALANIDKQKEAIEDGEPQGTERIVASLHEHVL